MRLLFIFLFLISTFGFSQPDTDVFLMDLERTDTTFTISNFKNISNNEGYDNQPSFLGNDKLLYAGSENGQTEIQLYSISEQKKQRVNSPTTGGEYSPQKFPQQNKIASVRLDTTGLQRLYSYELKGENKGQSKLLLSDLEVAYFAFYDENWIVASILAGNQLDLVIANIDQNEAGLYVENAGRSIHKVPNSKNVSYTVANEEKNHDIFVVDVKNPKETFFVCQLPVGIQDYAWIDATTLILGSGSKLYLYDMFGPGEWTEVADLANYKIDNITRIAVSPNKKLIALAAEAAE